MLKVQEIRELIKLIDQSSIDELTYEEDGAKIKLKKNNTEGKRLVPRNDFEEQANPVVVTEQPKSNPQAVQVEQVKEVAQQTDTNNEVDTNLHKIESPMVGTFYSSPSPEEPSYVKVGDKVSKNSIVCIVEAMKLFNEIEAEVNGEIVEVLVENGQLVEYGQPLFLVKTE